MHPAFGQHHLQDAEPRDARHLRVHHRLHERARDRRIDGVATPLQHQRASLHRLRLRRDDHPVFHGPPSFIPARLHVSGNIAPMACMTYPARFAAILAALLLAACQSSQVFTNKPLVADPAVYSSGYRLGKLIDKPGGHVFLVLAFSGGGKRSAAFAHGALRGLRDIVIDEDGEKRNLLSEVDYIAAVSGGSFPAMHYGLYGDKSFDTFPGEFLKQDINSYIFGTYLLPWNWEWLVNPLYGTNDRMAAIYDKLMFRGATYADLQARGLPLISINATDIANGVSFSFTQPSFDLLCSDLSSFPVARAVAASNGFPVLFTPITLTSHRAGCPVPRPEDPGRATLVSGSLSRQAALLRTTDRYLDPARTEYLHLMDGGIADNLAMRSLLNGLIALDSNPELLRRVAPNVRRVLVISVDGQAATDPTLGKTRIVTGLGQVFSAVSGTQIDSYNFETLLLADQQTKGLVERLRTERCSRGRMIQGRPCDDVQGELVHISLSDVQDVALRDRLQAIPTGLTIPDQDVDSLVALGERLIVQNPRIAAVLSGLSGPVPAASARR